jgi:alpha-tubulin suppressor-like RCC1 family protein
VKSLEGRYVLRTDGALLYESDPTSTLQTPVLDAASGLPLTGMTGVQDGAFHGCAVQGTTGMVWCWRTGADGNAYGQLGDGTTDTLTTSFLATQVLTAANTPLTGVVAVADTEILDGVAGAGSACAVKGDGTLYCWGTLSYLTNGGTALTSAFAVPVTTDGVTPFGGVLQVAVAYGGYACAVVQGASARELWCWGRNANGYLGLGDLTNRRFPTHVVGIDNPVKVVAHDYAGGSVCVLDGTQVRCWGYNAEGQTGTGTTNTPIKSPALVTLLGGTTPLANVVDLHGGDNGELANFCALSSGGTLLCWGDAFQSYPTDLGVTNVVALGGTGAYVRYLTDDGLYHHGTPSNHVGATRVPNCGPLH